MSLFNVWTHHEYNTKSPNWMRLSIWQRLLQNFSEGSFGSPNAQRKGMLLSILRNKATKNGRQPETGEKKHRGRLHGLKLHTFASWKSPILFCPNFKIFDVLNLSNLKAATVYKASWSTEAELAFIDSVVLQDCRLFSRQMVEASRVIAHQKARSVVILDKDISKQMDFLWRCVTQNAKEIYSGQNQPFLRLQISKLYLDWVLQYSVYFIWSIRVPEQGAVMNGVVSPSREWIYEIGHSTNVSRAENYADVQLDNVRFNGQVHPIKRAQGGLRSLARRYRQLRVHTVWLETCLQNGWIPACNLAWQYFLQGKMES